MRKILARMLLASLAVTMTVWLDWSLLTPVSLRIAKAALLHWGLLAAVGITALLAVAWVLCRLLPLAPEFYPVLAGLVSAAVVAVLYWLSPSGLPLQRLWHGHCRGGCGLSFHAGDMAQGTCLRTSAASRFRLCRSHLQMLAQGVMDEKKNHIFDIRGGCIGRMWGEESNGGWGYWVGGCIIASKKCVIHA